MATLREHIWFSQTGLSHPKRELLLEYFGSPAEIYAASGVDFAGMQGITRADIALLSNKSLNGSERIIEDCARRGIGIITRQDTGYPSRLLEIPDPPQVLYTLGNLPDMDSVLPIGVVGTRHPSEYGLYMADLIAGQLARAGALVISGMALGIDSSANRSALNEGRPTVAVMGCGADICYPPSEQKLWRRIIENGAVITEYPPGTPPYGGNFLERNRIISGLSLAVVLINVASRSGAMNTASHALRQGREVFCVPANVDSNENEGVTQLLKNGAGVVENASDILEGFCFMFNGLDMKAAADRRGKIPPTSGKSRPAPGSHYARRGEACDRRPQKDAPPSVKVVKTAESWGSGPKPAVQPRPDPELEGNRKLIYDSLKASETVHIDKICEITGLPASDILSELIMLELDGHISSLPGKFFSVNRLT